MEVKTFPSILLSLLLLLPSLGMAQDYGSGSPQVMISPAAAPAGGGGFTLFLNDDFEDNVTDWNHAGGAGGDVIHHNSDALGMQLRGPYHYDYVTDTGSHAPEGGAPTSNDVWCSFILDTDGDVDNVGCAFRLPDDDNMNSPASTDHFYNVRLRAGGAMRWEVNKGACHLSACPGDIIHNTTATITDADGDMFAAILLGTYNNSEVAFFHTAEADLLSAYGGSGSVDPGDPSTWEAAVECVADTTATPLLDAVSGISCNTDVACSETSCLGATDPTGEGTDTDDLYPEATHSEHLIGPFASTSNDRAIKEFWGGEVD